MGYRSIFKIKTRPAQSQRRIDTGDHAYNMMTNIEGEYTTPGAIKWYNYDRDMKAFSRTHSESTILVLRIGCEDTDPDGMDVELNEWKNGSKETLFRGS